MNIIITPEHIAKLAFERECKLARIENERAIERAKAKLAEWRRQDEARAKTFNPQEQK